MTQFDVLEEGSLLFLGEQGPQFDEVPRHFFVKLGLEAGHLLEGGRDRGFVERAGSGEESREILTLRIDRGLAGDQARMVRHRDRMDLLLLLRRQVQHVEGIVGRGLNRRSIGMHAIRHREGNQNRKHNRGQS